MIKRFYDYIKESFGLNYIKNIAEFTKGNGKQGEYFQWQYTNAKEIKVSKTPKGINKGIPVKRECYKNAFKVVSDNYTHNIMYVEGYVIFHDIPIEHAWNKIGDIYFDVTAELNKSVYSEYISITEIGYDKIHEYAYKTGHYGSYLKPAFEDNIKG
jgi:hypothetical protein